MRLDLVYPPLPETKEWILTQNDGLEKVAPFKNGQFLVSMR